MRFILWSLLAAFLIVVGLWPAAAAPVVLASAGLTVVVAKIPGVLLLVAAVAYLRRKPARPATV
ncbi:hypothetical protein [Streptomyces mirabilis]|uniref:hypothetical protein n=1 Tax=Streptomyces mirabilis TaxID=68239 RepID=UPI0033D6BBB1